MGASTGATMPARLHPHDGDPMLRCKRGGTEAISMALFDKSVFRRSSLCVSVLGRVALTGDAQAQPAKALTPAVEFASHRAIYELSLAQSRGNSTVSARGRILYDFSGSACDGYALQFRQV